MNNINKMVKLNFIITKTTISKYFIIGIYATFFIMGSVTGMYTFSMTYGMFFSMLFATAPLGYSQLNNIDLLYCTLGIKRREVVAGTYVYGAIVVLFSGLAGVILSVAGAQFALLVGIDIEPQTAYSFVQLFPVIFTGVILLYAIQFFSSFVGTKKAKFWYAFLMFVGLCILLLISVIGSMSDEFDLELMYGNILIFLIHNLWLQYSLMVLILTISCTILYKKSVKAYTARDF
ncbi:MAG: ABC-2 transporter permease [Oscillospiraceae bacterium]|jgi:hypothetical protein|nr:ABC-2 transporter permease [Oscillospiraceae bacterium]